MRLGPTVASMLLIIPAAELVPSSYPTDILYILIDYQGCL